MRTTTFLSIALTGMLLACSSPSGPAADRIVYRTSDAPTPALDAMEESQARQQPRAPILNEMTEGERIAWFQGHGVYPHPWYPHPDDQSMGYVNTPTDWGWVMPAILTAGAIYGLYRVKRHNDWHW